MRTQTFMTAMLVALTMGASMHSDATAYSRYRTNHRTYRTYRNSSVNNNNNNVVPAGTAIDVRLNQTIATDNMSRGETWTGTVNSAVVTRGGVAIEAGTPVEGTISSAVQGTHSTPAQLTLTLRRINGRSVFAQAEPIVAGSQRAHKMGAVLGGAAAGALLGHALGHHGALGALGGAAAGYGLTRHAFRTMQLREGTVVRFVTTSRMLANR